MFNSINQNKMKTFKCPDCKRVYEKSDLTIMVQCVCGSKATEIENKTHRPIKQKEDDEIQNYLDKSYKTMKEKDISVDDYNCPICKQIGKGQIDNYEDDGVPCKIFTCECGHEEVTE